MIIGSTDEWERIDCLRTDDGEEVFVIGYEVNSRILILEQFSVNQSAQYNNSFNPTRYSTSAPFS